MPLGKTSPGSSETVGVGVPTTGIVKLPAWPTENVGPVVLVKVGGRVIVSVNDWLTDPDEFAEVIVMGKTPSTEGVPARTPLEKTTPLGNVPDSENVGAG
jgi:hypothetical protein